MGSNGLDSSSSEEDEGRGRGRGKTGGGGARIQGERTRRAQTSGELNKARYIGGNGVA